MYEITFLVFIRYRGPFGLSVPLPRFRTAHVNKPLRVFHRFSLEDVFAPVVKEEDWASTIPYYLRHPTPIPGRRKTVNPQRRCSNAACV